MKTERAIVKLNDYEISRCKQAVEFFETLCDTIDDAENKFSRLDCDFYSSSIISGDENEKGYIPTYTIKDIRDLLYKIRDGKGFYIYKDKKEET